MKHQFNWDEDVRHLINSTIFETLNMVTGMGLGSDASNDNDVFMVFVRDELTAAEEQQVKQTIIGLVKQHNIDIEEQDIAIKVSGEWQLN
jgi:hypothetical protein